MPRSYMEVQTFDSAHYFTSQLNKGEWRVSHTDALTCEERTTRCFAVGGWVDCSVVPGSGAEDIA